MKYSALVISGFLALYLAPTSINAYFTPEEVLLYSDYYLPPSPRETEDRVAAQNERTVSYINSLNKAAAEAEANLSDEDEAATEEDDSTATLLLENLSEEDLALLNTIRLLDAREQRLLDRVQANQYIMNQPNLHSGAPPLAPTGAGGILTALTMIGAVVWTIRQVKNAQKVVAVEY